MAGGPVGAPEDWAPALAAGPSSRAAVQVSVQATRMGRRRTMPRSHVALDGPEVYVANAQRPPPAGSPLGAGTHRGGEESALPSLGVRVTTTRVGDRDHTRGARQGKGRRRFLRLGIGGAVLVGLGGLLGWQTSGYRVPPEVARALASLTPKQYWIVRAIATRILRRDADDLPTAEQVEAARFIDAFAAELHPSDRRDMGRLLALVEHVLPFTYGHFDRFTRLDGAAQDQVLAAMMKSSVGTLRGGFDALKSLCVMAYFRDARTWPAIGYGGPWVRP